MRRWARTLALTLLGAWLVVGVPLTIVIFLVLATSKDPSVTAALIAAVLLGLSYLLIPGVLIRFYRSRDVRRTFESHDPSTYGIAKLPIPILVLSILYLLYIVLLHAPIFFNGLFPLFGVLQVGLPGILWLDAAMACLACLLWGVLKLKPWAWWGSVAYFGLMIASLFLTLSPMSVLDVFVAANFPPKEMEFLQGIPLQGWHLALFIGLPLVITWALILFSKQYFRRDHAQTSGEV